MSDSTMTPRERVLTALAHQPTDRTPFTWGFGPRPLVRKALGERLAPLGVDWDAFKRLTSDVLTGQWTPRKTPLGEDQSIWGFTYTTVDHGSGGTYEEFDNPPFAEAETVEEIENHPWPSCDDVDYSQVRERILAADPDRRYAIQAGSANPLEIFTWMTGLEQTLIWMMTDPEIITAGLERITSYFVENIRRTLEAADGLIDIWFCADDVGGQQGPLFSPVQYRELIQPFHRRIFEAIHEFGVNVFYHSDGSCFALLGDLLDAGIDTLDAVQVECADMEPEKLKATFGERLAYHGGVSVQQVLPRKTPEEVRAHVRHLIDTLGAGGGYICAPSHAIQDGTPGENVVAMIEEVKGMPLSEIVRTGDPR